MHLNPICEVAVSTVWAYRSGRAISLATIDRAVRGSPPDSIDDDAVGAELGRRFFDHGISAFELRSLRISA